MEPIWVSAHPPQSFTDTSLCCCFSRSIYGLEMLSGWVLLLFKDNSWGRGEGEEKHSPIRPGGPDWPVFVVWIKACCGEHTHAQTNSQAHTFVHTVWRLGVWWGYKYHCFLLLVSLVSPTETQETGTTQAQHTHPQTHTHSQRVPVVFMIYHS